MAEFESAPRKIVIKRSLHLFKKIIFGDFSDEWTLQRAGFQVYI